MLSKSPVIVIPSRGCRICGSSCNQSLLIHLVCRSALRIPLRKLNLFVDINFVRSETIWTLVPVSHEFKENFCFELVLAIFDSVHAINVDSCEVVQVEDHLGWVFFLNHVDHLVFEIKAVDESQGS